MAKVTSKKAAAAASKVLKDDPDGQSLVWRSLSHEAEAAWQQRPGAAGCTSQ